MRLIILFLLSSTIVFSQNLKSVAELTSNITKEANSDSLKIVKIVDWITANIEFNLKAYKTSEIIINSSEIIDKKVAASEGYAHLFADMLNAVKIKNAIIIGYYKGVFYEINDVFLTENHIWNVVFVNNKWYLFDLTLASGYLKNENTSNSNLQKINFVKIFNKDMVFANAETFLQTHLSNQKHWQLAYYPISIANFEKNIVNIKKQEKFNFEKEIALNIAKKDNYTNKIKSLENVYKENVNNYLSVAKKYNLMAINESVNLVNKSIADENEYKKTIAKVNKISNLSVIQIQTHINNLKKENKNKLAKNKNFNNNNLANILMEINNLSKKIGEREQKILQQNTITNSLIEFQNIIEKSKINDENNLALQQTDIKENEKLQLIYVEINSQLNNLKKIQNDTSTKHIKRIHFIEDSLNKVINMSHNLEKNKTRFIENFSWNNIKVFNSLTDSLESNNILINNLLAIQNYIIDSVYKNVETNLKTILNNVEINYKKINATINTNKLGQKSLTFFNLLIDSIYNTTQNVVKQRNKEILEINKYLALKYYENYKNLMLTKNKQADAEKSRFAKFNEYYSSITNQKIEFFTKTIEKYNTKITKPFKEYQKEGIEPIEKMEFILIE